MTLENLFLAPLPDRGLIMVSGEEAPSFLQGIITNDIEKLGKGQALYAALLSAQGRYLHDFFLFELDGAIFIDCEAMRRADLLRRLTLYRLRAKANLEDRSEDYQAYALWGEGWQAQTAALGGWAYADPRLPQLGARIWIKNSAPLSIPGAQSISFETYDRHRLSIGVADGSRDLEIDRALIMEGNFEELSGVDFKKGCYVGQEVTARMKYRSLIKKRLLPVSIEGGAVETGLSVMMGEQEAGVMRSSRDGLGLALLRLDAANETQMLRCGQAKITLRWPDWLAKP